jgi:hypothetical protein
MVPTKFYNDEVRSWQEPDGRTYMVLHDPCLAMGLDPQGQVRAIKQDQLFEGFLSCRQMLVSQPNGGIRLHDMDGLALEMVNMWLARIRVNMVSEIACLKMLRYQRECAKVLSQ